MNWPTAEEVDAEPFRWWWVDNEPSRLGVDRMQDPWRVTWRSRFVLDLPVVMFGGPVLSVDEARQLRASRQAPPWAFADPETAPNPETLRFRCTRCATVKDHALPLSLSDVAELAGRFERAHATCTDSPVMSAVRRRPGMGHIRGTDVDLLRRALTSRHGWKRRQTRAAQIQNLTTHGAGVSIALCAVMGLDPDEEGP